jgi:two-component system response regulator YesN
MSKYVYLFNEGNASMRNLLGGKGANLAEMTGLGLPVPRGFTVTTEACTRYYNDGKVISEEIENEIYARVSENDGKAAILSFEQLYDRMCNNQNISFDLIKKWLIGIVVEFEKRWEKVLDNNYYRFLGEIISAKDEGVLFQIGKRYISDTVNQIISNRQSKANSIIEKANQYIQEYYNEDISLDEIARHVNLSSYYFSRFYKNSTGTSFSDKMVMVRMEKAKELLKKEELSIKDVSFMVGYVDPNYFSKIFKKFTGYNASEYKKMYGL